MLGAPMLRVLLLVGTVLVTQVVGSVAIVRGAVCPERCPDDGPDGRCPPSCLSCPCTARPARPVSAPIAETPETRHEAARSPLAVAPRAPEPRDIFHVPKRFLA